MNTMHYYTVSPNKEGTAWFLKNASYTPQETYDKYDDAVNAAYEAAKDNQPSTVTVLNETFEIQETQVFR